jgi:hypothetical protein
MRPSAIGLVLGLAVLVAATADATTITLVNLDGAGEGFNDSTPRSPEGGNPGTTLGLLRQNAFNEAADRWEAVLGSSVVIQAEATFDPLTPCGGGGALLGFAGPNTVHRDFIGAPVASTWFSQAEANSLSGVDLDAVPNRSVPGSPIQCFFLTRRLALHEIRKARHRPP